MKILCLKTTPFQLLAIPHVIHLYLFLKLRFFLAAALAYLIFFQNLVEFFVNPLSTEQDWGL